MRSIGASARRASHQPAAAATDSAIGRAISSSTRTRCTERSTGASDDAATTTRRCPAARDGLRRDAEIRAAELARWRRPPASAARHRIAERRDHASRRVEHLRRGPLPRQHGARRVSELWQPLVAIARRRSADRRAQRPVGRVGEVGAQPDDHERADRDEDEREHRDVPRRHPHADRRVHRSASRTKPAPRTVRISGRPTRACGARTRRRRRRCSSSPRSSRPRRGRAARARVDELAGVAREVLEHRELARGQLHLRAAARHRVAAPGRPTRSPTRSVGGRCDGPRRISARTRASSSPKSNGLAR